MKRSLAAFLLFAASALPAAAQSYTDIDVDLPMFPEMQPVPDSPVYWAPGVDSNYFFYDGLFWDYFHDLWHWSAWYNGPWMVADPIYVPTYVLWVPIRYYRKPTPYIAAGNPNRPPRWSEFWGTEWQARHNEIYRGAAGPFARAPLPTYQAQFARGNYPRNPQQQFMIHGQNYAYQPREAVSRQVYQARGVIVTANPTLRGHSPPPPDGRRDDAPRERR